jgi:phage protein U
MTDAAPPRTTALMSLGLFVFSLPTIVFTELSHNLAVRFAKNERFGGADAVQFIGPGDETITLTGVTALGINDADTAFGELETMMASGRAWPLVDGQGKVWGDYIILGLDRQGSLFKRGGVPTKTGWTINLSRVISPMASQNRDQGATVNE